MSRIIAAYLDELDHALAFDRSLSRRVRSEVESHLTEAAEARGEVEAVTRFGQPATIARAYAEAALPNRMRRSYLTAALLFGVTLLLMRLRTVFLDLPSTLDPLTLLDRTGVFVGLACVAAAWIAETHYRFAPTDRRLRRALHIAVGALALSVGASLLRAVPGVTDGDAALLVGASVLVEMLFVALLLARLAQLDRYARRLAG